jgi:hypothetical protein
VLVIYLADLLEIESEIAFHLMQSVRFCESLVVVEKTARAFAKKVQNQENSPARATAAKITLASAFRIEYNQNYGVRRLA